MFESDKSEKLWGWFGLSYASWLTLPRVLMHAMPKEWQDKMADLLYEIEEVFPNLPESERTDSGTRVLCIDKNGRYEKTPDWIKNYRHPDYEKINSFRKKDSK